MAKFYTKRKYHKKTHKQKDISRQLKLPVMPPDLVRDLNREIALTTDKIRLWTRQQLSAYQNNRNPVCIPVNDGYKIGLYKLQIHTNRSCIVYDRNDELVHVFENKINAILYTIYIIKQNIELANEILALDVEINKNYTDALFLRRGISNANKNKDFIALDAKQARLDIIEKRLLLAQEKMAKIHVIAKISKVWQ